VILQRKIVQPGWSQPCFCGSTKKFGVCCRNRLPAFEIGKKYSSACAARNWELALLATRADITQYTIWHKSNTAPVLKLDRALGMLRIDVNALSAYVERLQWLYIRTGRSSDWLDTLERLKDNIQHPSWRRKIAYFRALFHLQPQFSREDARRELKKVGPITTDETDIELLQIFLDLEFSRLSFAERLKYLDRILAISKDLGDQLQYRGSKAIQYFLIGDLAAAEGLMAEVVRLGRDPENQPLSRYQNHMFVHGVQHLGMLRHDRSLLGESIGILSGMLLDDEWTLLGRASINREIGESYKFLEDWASAEKAHKEALALHEDPIDRIHIAEAMLYQKKVDEACTQIDLLKQEDLSGSAYEDYIFAYAIIAIWSAEKVRLEKALSLLESYTAKEPYFRERRLALLLSVNSGISKGTVSPEQKQASAPKGGFLSLLSKVFMIQPNVAGIGINFNAILDELAKKEGKVQAKPDTDEK
jgi:tetratricopeptide (TPR) repeat protein